MTGKKSENNSKLEKYKRFCLAFRANGGNATEAAKAVGYAEKSASVAGSRLLKNDKVQQMLKELSNDSARKRIITIEKRQEVLSVIALDESAEHNARIRAIDVLNKMDGIYIAKVEVNVGGSLAVKLKERAKRGG